MKRDDLGIRTRTMVLVCVLLVPLCLAAVSAATLQGSVPLTPRGAFGQAAMRPGSTPRVCPTARCVPPGPLPFDSSNCRFVGNWPFGASYAVAVDSARNLVFCGSGGGVYALDVSNPAQPQKLSEAIHTRGVVDGLAYAAERL